MANIYGYFLCFRCKRLKCFDNISEEEQFDILQRVHDLPSKDQQDLFIQGLIESNDVQRHRTRNSEGTRHVDKTFSYFIYVGNERKEVCYKAFLSLLAITDKRVKRLRKLALLGQSPCDRRGKNPSGNALPPESREVIRQHIESFPVKESHYSGRTYRFLDSRLNVKKMHKMFLEKHPGIKCSYQTYIQFFKDNYSLSFGCPQVDTCCVCEELNIKIRNSHVNDKAKRCALAELLIHKRRAKKFYNMLKNGSQRKDQPNVLAIAIDFMQNIQLPVIPVQETFYLRQLTTNVFCIHNVKTNAAKLYVYHEGVGKKGPNEVCLFLYDYIKSAAPEIEELHLYSDNCGGQNKNHALSRFLLALTDSKRFKKIEHYFPVRGHSYLPCDRDFSLIKRSLRSHDRIYGIDEVTEIIKTSCRLGKFEVKVVQSSEILNFKSWWPHFYKKTCTSEETISRTVKRQDKVHFGISSLMHFKYNHELKGCIIGSQFIESIVTHTFRLGYSGKSIHSFPPPQAYSGGRISIK